MADAAIAADSNICAACLLACTSAIWSFCLFKPYGSDPNSTPCGGNRGCCGSCFQQGFDEDEFDEVDRRADDRRRKERERNEQHAKDNGLKENATSDTKEAVPEAVGEDKTKAGDKTPPSPSVPDIVVHQPSPMPAMNDTTS